MFRRRYHTAWEPTVEAGFDRRPARERYASLVIGNNSAKAFLKYECIQAFSQWVPGLPGLLLRRTLYPKLLGTCGPNVTFGQNVVLRHPHKIHILNDVVIEDNCLLDASGEGIAGGIWIRPQALIGRNSTLVCNSGVIILERRISIGSNCEIFSASRVTIGAETTLSAYVHVDAGNHLTGERATSAEARVSQGVAIGAGTWLGSRATVLDGVAIGDGVTVCAGTVVRRNLPDGITAMGASARLLPRKASTAREAG